MSFRFRKAVQFAAILGIIALAGCARRTATVYRASAFTDTMEGKINSALWQGKPAAAREILAAALRAQPQNGYFHLLNGLTYQIEDNSLQSLNLAKVGYDAAVKFCPGHYWSHYLAGFVSLDLQDWPEAADHFCGAILSDPSRFEAFLGLATSAYFAGDLEIAEVAAERALTIAPTNPLALRTAAFVAAAQGKRESLDALLKRAESTSPMARVFDNHKSRLNQVLRTAAMSPVQDDSDSKGMPIQPSIEIQQNGKAGPEQVMVEVTILLNQTQTAQNTGINLLDGLAVQFGLEHRTEQRNVTGLPKNLTKVFTTAMKVPDITYSLNFFNTREDFYRVIARPSLVAYLGKPSEFFIGRNVVVGVSGINLGSIQPVDVGISIKVTPIEITRAYARFEVGVVRSFFSKESGGTFQQSLTTFKQTVSATTEVEFGRTLILSGLYESVHTGASSKTPVLGDIPGVKTVFNGRTQTERQDVALVLVTPRLTGSIETETRQFRGETLNRLFHLWKDFIDPRSNMEVIIGILEKRGKKAKLYSAMLGDLKVPSVSEPEVIKSIIHETMAQIGK